MEKINPYYKLIEQILADFRITANGMQDKYELRSFSTIVNKLKRDADRKLHPETIGKIEKALNIIIDDSDPENITYKVLEPPVTNKISNISTNGIAIEGAKTIGIVDSLTEGIEEMRKDILAYTIKQSDKTDIFKVGEDVLIDTSEEIKTNDIVIVKQKNGEVKIKKCIVNELFLILVDKDFNVEQIDYSQIEYMYRLYGNVIKY